MSDDIRLRMLDLPTFDDLAPILLRGLDDDEAMSAFQLLVIAGYRIISSERLDEVAEEAGQAVERYAAVRHAYAVEAQARGAAEAHLAAIEAAVHEVLHAIQRGHEHEVDEAVDAAVSEPSIGYILRRLVECGGAVEELGGLWHIARSDAVTYCGEECSDWPRVAHAVERRGIWCGICLMTAAEETRCG